LDLFGDSRKQVTEIPVPFFGLVLAFLTGSFVHQADAGIGKGVTALGTLEVRAKLAEIQAPFLPNDLYNYAFVMKYKVLASTVEKRWETKFCTTLQLPETACQRTG